jgi:CarD family transcriptional regulator
MYGVGDKIVYPMHGAGVIESIEEREFLGQRQDYYVLKLPVGDMRVMVPTRNVAEIGIRDVIDAGEVEGVLDVLRLPNVESGTNWNRRYRENMIKIKSGSIYEVADVVRSLTARERGKGLSTGERKMLSSARQILISELVMAKGTDQIAIEEIIEECVNCCAV